MIISPPPRLATWLLKRLVSGHKRESLLGDLVEQYQHRLSSVWFWQQVINAIFVATIQDVSDHKLLTASAVFTCWTLLWFLGVFARQFYRWMGLFVWHWTAVHELDTLWWWWVQYQPLVLALLCVNAAFAGWIVSRLNREIRSTLVLICAASLCLFWMAPQFGFVWHWGYFARKASNPAAQSWINFTFNFIAMPIAVLLGGLWRERSLHVESVA
jgi:hypothetical protein